MIDQARAPISRSRAVDIAAHSLRSWAIPASVNPPERINFLGTHYVAPLPSVKPHECWLGRVNRKLSSASRLFVKTRAATCASR